MDYVSIPLSVISLAISLGTFWLAVLHRGRLAMTKPTIVLFGYDIVPKPAPKVFLRTLLYSTSTRGQVVEGIYAVVRHNDAERVFSFWGYGETEKLSPGSGLHISRTGMAVNHHFVLSVHEGAYQFEPGGYEIDVIANVVGRKNPIKLSTIRLALNADHVAALTRHEGVLFERKIGGAYEGHTR